MKASRLVVAVAVAVMCAEGRVDACSCGAGRIEAWPSRAERLLLAPVFLLEASSEFSVRRLLAVRDGMAYLKGMGGQDTREIALSIIAAHSDAFRIASVVFAPRERLRPNTEYTMWLRPGAGTDERERTVSDSCDSDEEAARTAWRTVETEEASGVPEWTSAPVVKNKVSTDGVCGNTWIEVEFTSSVKFVFVEVEVVEVARGIVQRNVIPIGKRRLRIGENWCEKRFRLSRETDYSIRITGVAQDGRRSRPYVLEQVKL